MKKDCRKNLNDRDRDRKPVKRTRFHELHLYPLPFDADQRKVKALIEPVSGVKLKDIRIHRNRSGNNNINRILDGERG